MIQRDDIGNGDAQWGKPRARGLKTTCVSLDISHVLIFIFPSMLESLLIKSQPFVAMEPNQTQSLSL